MSKKPKTFGRIIKKIFLFIIIVALIGLAGLIGYEKLRQEYKTVYDSYTSQIGTISNSLSFSGNLNLVDSEVITATAKATVKNVYVKAGDMVKDGDKLVRLSNGTTLKANMDGRVNTVSCEVDDLVDMGSQLMQIADFNHMKMTVRVDEYDIADISVGDECRVTVTSNELTYTSKIDSINYISSSNGNVAYYSATIYVDIDDDKTLPGMQATAVVPMEEATDVVILKADAISFDDTNKAYVYMKDEEGNLTEVYITTGVSNGNYVEIKEGLSDGDEVFAEVKEEVKSALGGLFASMFGSQEFNQGGGRGGSFGGGNMPSFDSGSMPSFGSGEMPSMPQGGFSGGSGSSGGPSNRGSMGGGAQ